MRQLCVALALALACAFPAAAQEIPAEPATIEPGMTKAQVIERLGPPLSERARGSFTYLYYRNDCERECGMSDLVILRDDAVTDAIFRSPARRYAGTSSSPAALTPSQAVANAGVTGELRVVPPSAPATPPADTLPPPAPSQTPPGPPGAPPASPH